MCRRADGPLGRARRRPAGGRRHPARQGHARACRNGACLQVGARPGADAARAEVARLGTRGGCPHGAEADRGRAAEAGYLRSAAPASPRTWAGPGTPRATVPRPASGATAPGVLAPTSRRGTVGHPWRMSTTAQKPHRGRGSRSAATCDMRTAMASEGRARVPSSFSAGAKGGTVGHRWRVSRRHRSPPRPGCRGLTPTIGGVVSAVAGRVCRRPPFSGVFCTLDIRP